MIMFWNRREVFVGNSMKDFSNIRSILATNKIKYDYKIVNHLGSGGRGHSGAFGVNADYAYLYYVYVHRKDYELACNLLHKDR